jgi:hypothetical protein
MKYLLIFIISLTAHGAYRADIAKKGEIKFSKKFKTMERLNKYIKNNERILHGKTHRNSVGS